MKWIACILVISLFTLLCSGAITLASSDEQLARARTNAPGIDDQVPVGAPDVDSSEILCSDVNGDGRVYTIGDIVHLVRYISGNVHAVAPLENSDVDLCGSVNMSDLALYLQFFVWGMVVPICQPTEECYLPTGTNEVALGCPIEIPVNSTDSFPLPIYVSNDTDVVALSLGFRYDSDDIEIVSLDTTGSILPPSWSVATVSPSDSDYVFTVPDSNMILIMCFADIPEYQHLSPQEDGLLTTLWLRAKQGAAEQIVDFDSAFVLPAGELIFSPVGKGSIRPTYTDCGTEDVILFDYVCGDADGSGEVDVDDVVLMIQCIFADCWDIPIEQLDADCSGDFDIDDVVYLILYIFAGGKAPCDIDGDSVPDC
jgi:hypothetical protein